MSGDVSADHSPAQLPLADLTWPSVPSRPLVLVPVGATEQHGPHLPLDTDTVIAERVSMAAAAGVRRVGGVDVVVAPAIAYGASGEHQGFAGTCSIGSAVLHAVLVELARSLRLWAGRVVLINAHGGNVPTVPQAVRQLRVEGHDVCWVSCGNPGGDAHAGYTETSLMLHLEPLRVAPFETVLGIETPLPELLPQLRSTGVRAVSASGVLGSPRGATADTGRRLFDEICKAVTSSILTGHVNSNGLLTTRKFF